MEYIAGTTLQQRLLEGRMPLVDALRVAGEIAEALEEAHAGIFDPIRSEPRFVALLKKLQFAQ